VNISKLYQPDVNGVE